MEGDDVMTHATKGRGARMAGFGLILCLLILLCYVLLHYTSLAGNSSGFTSDSLGLVLSESENGLKIVAVAHKSIGERAGLQPGDLLTQMNQYTLTQPAAMDRLLTTACREPLQIVLMRDGAEMNLTIPYID